MTLIVIGITRTPHNAYRVFWKENNVDVEAKAYYTDDPEDAVDTLIDMYKRAQDNVGLTVKVSDAQYTKTLVSKYRWLWLQNRLKGD